MDAIADLAKVLLPAGLFCMACTCWYARSSTATLTPVTGSAAARLKPFCPTDCALALSVCVLFWNVFHLKICCCAWTNPASCMSFTGFCWTRSRNEYNHNVSQQIYMSENVWNLVKNSRRIWSSWSTRPPLNSHQKPPADLARKIFELAMNKQVDPMGTPWASWRKRYSKYFKWMLEARCWKLENTLHSSSQLPTSSLKMLTAIQRVTKGSVTINQMRKKRLEPVLWFCWHWRNRQPRRHRLALDQNCKPPHFWWCRRRDECKSEGCRWWDFAHQPVYASCQHEERQPTSYIKAAKPDIAIPLLREIYSSHWVESWQKRSRPENSERICWWKFQQRSVTILIDTKNRVWCQMTDVRCQTIMNRTSDKKHLTLT